MMVFDLSLSQLFLSSFTAPSALKFFSLCAGGDNAAGCSDTLDDTERQRHLLTLLASDLSPASSLPLALIFFYSHEKRAETFICLFQRTKSTGKDDFRSKKVFLQI